MLKMFSRLCALAAVAFLGAPHAKAVSLTGIESFEGVQVGGNVVSPGGSYLRIIGPITFASGVSLVGPFPQPVADNAILINDFVRGGGYGLADHGFIGTASQVPHGSAFLASGDQDDRRPFEFTFPSEMRRVSALVTGAYSNIFPNPFPPGYDITMTAFDAAGTQLAVQSILSVHRSRWNDNLLQVEAPGIRKITIDGYIIVIDALRFTSVPESRSVTLLAPALGALVVFNRRRQGLAGR